jgi:hypothetical protein
MTSLSPAGKVPALQIKRSKSRLDFQVTIGLGSRPIGSMVVGLAGGFRLPGER